MDDLNALVLLQDGRRYQTFKANVQRIIAANKDPSTLHWSTLNAFAALTWQEFQAKFTMQQASSRRKRRANAAAGGGQASPTVQAAAAAASDAVPLAVDWRAHGKVTPPKFQGEVSGPAAAANDVADDGTVQQKLQAECLHSCRLGRVPPSPPFV